MTVEGPAGTGLPAVLLKRPPSDHKGSDTYREWAMESVLKLVSAGWPYRKACKELGYTYQTVFKWRERYPEWGRQLEDAKEGILSYRTEFSFKEMRFPEFVKRYFGISLARHQLEIADLLEDTGVITKMILGFPEAGKSTVAGLWYLLYRICLNPEIRILLVVKSNDRARDMMDRVKRYMTMPHLYEGMEGNLIEDVGGFRPEPNSGYAWRQDRITIRQRKSGERDYTLQTVGVEGAVYGTRLDLILMDDALDTNNQKTDTYKDNINRWFMTTITSRAQRGEIIINGTRLRPDDLYGKWKRFWQDEPDFKCLKIPAILNENTPEEESSWPEMFPLDGYWHYDEWRGRDVRRKGMRDIRRQQLQQSADSWKLAYQQEDIESYEAVFKMDPHITTMFQMGSVYGAGEVEPDEKLILGVDPATSGRAASVVLAYNPNTNQRRVVDLYVGEYLAAQGVRQELFYQFWEKYALHGIDVTAVEINYAPTLMGDELFMMRANLAKTDVVPHRTFGANVRGRKGAKHDEEYGVGALAPKIANGLFAMAGKTVQDRRLMEPLINDMLVFPYEEPTGDALMAFWIADSAVNDLKQRRIDQAMARRMADVPPYLLQHYRDAQTTRALAREKKDYEEKMLERFAKSVLV